MKGKVKPGRTTEGFRFGGTVGTNSDPGFTRRSAAAMAKSQNYSLDDDPLMGPQLKHGDLKSEKKSKTGGHPV